MATAVDRKLWEQWRQEIDKCPRVRSLPRRSAVARSIRSTRPIISKVSSTRRPSAIRANIPTRGGVHATMYRGRLWTMRQFAGFGTAQQTNERFKFLVERGQTGLSTAFDLPTLMGLDSDDPRSLGEVGRLGVAVDTIDDMRQLFDGIDIGKLSVSMTINAPAAVVMAFYLANAQDRGFDWRELRGTIQNDTLKEFHAQNEIYFPPEPSCAPGRST